MDILSGLFAAEEGSKYLLVVVDAFTKWVEAYPLPDQEAATCITAVYNGMFSRFGLPRQLHSDQGRNFESQLVTELCNITGVYKTRTTAFHPRSDGLTERANRTILAMLRGATYKDTKPMDLGFCDILEHDIDTGDAEPIRQPPRRPPLSARKGEEDILNEMLKTGVIEPSNSPWSSRCVWSERKTAASDTALTTAG